MKARTAIAGMASLLVALALHAQAPAPATSLPPGAEPYGPEVMIAKEDSVPVRTDPGFVYREIRFLSKGQEVVVDGRQGTWLHVRPGGWILEDHLIARDAVREAPAERMRLAAVREGIRVRQSPSTDAEIVRTLAAGEEVDVEGQQAGWWKLVEGGFVSASLLQAVGRPAAPPPDAAAVPWVVSADSANVRAARSTSSATIRKLARGEIVLVEGVLEGWAEVPGGWVRADLLTPPGPRTPPGASAPAGPAVGLAGLKRWSLVDLNGVIFEITDVSRTNLVANIRKEMRETGVLADDWTFLGLTIGVPEDAPYRFNYSPDKNTTMAVDVDGQKYGNVYARGPFDKLPAHVRQFFLPMTVGQGEKFDGILLFRPSLKAENIRELSIFVGGRMQRLYESR